MIIQAVKWIGGADGFLELIDQRQLPGKFVKLRCRGVKELCKAIKTLSIRGAPAIGVAAAYGQVLALQKLDAAADLQQGLAALAKAQDRLAATRPTAVNLFWALDRVKKSAEEFVAAHPAANLEKLRRHIFAEANAIYREDVDMCRRIGKNGQNFIKQNAGILTHCNAGALATAGQGTALSIMFQAHKRGKKFKVYVDETRPLLQGARLTAWELQQAGIETAVICDNAAAYLMKQGRISAVITGADRIAANGDAANKIGTYSLSILAREHGIPFYIAAPSSTFDLAIKRGGDIPIEQRPPDEIIRFADMQIAPNGVGVYNPAFDVTPAKNISAIITERGVIERPDARKIARHFA